MHSYRALPSEANSDWVLATSQYGGEFVSALHRGEVYATQFHPEKSGTAGLDLLRNFLTPSQAQQWQQPHLNGEAAGCTDPIEVQQWQCSIGERPHLDINTPQDFIFTCGFACARRLSACIWMPFSWWMVALMAANSFLTAVRWQLSHTSCPGGSIKCIPANVEDPVVQDGRQAWRSA